MSHEFVDTDSVQCLLKASCKEDVSEIFQEAFQCRLCPAVPDTSITKAGHILGIEKGQARQLMTTLCQLVRQALFRSSLEVDDFSKLFSDGFHKNLKDLLIQIVVENLPAWRTSAINSSVSLPRLVDFDWRIDVKSSSNSASQTNTPTCILSMRVAKPSERVGVASGVMTVDVELSRQTLDTMLDALGRIRSQLASVAARQA